MGAGRGSRTSGDAGVVLVRARQSFAGEKDRLVRTSKPGFSMDELATIYTLRRHGAGFEDVTEDVIGQISSSSSTAEAPAGKQIMDEIRPRPRTFPASRSR
jgi:hypothetical protein